MIDKFTIKEILGLMIWINMIGFVVIFSVLLSSRSRAEDALNLLARGIVRLLGGKKDE